MITIGLKSSSFSRCHDFSLIKIYWKIIIINKPKTSQLRVSKQPIWMHFLQLNDKRFLESILGPSRNYNNWWAALLSESSIIFYNNNEKIQRSRSPSRSLEKCYNAQSEARNFASTIIYDLFDESLFYKERQLFASKIRQNFEKYFAGAFLKKIARRSSEVRVFLNEAMICFVHFFVHKLLQSELEVWHYVIIIIIICIYCYKILRTSCIRRAGARWRVSIYIIIYFIFVLYISRNIRENFLNEQRSVKRRRIIRKRRIYLLADNGKRAKFFWRGWAVEARKLLFSLWENMRSLKLQRKRVCWNCANREHVNNRTRRNEILSQGGFAWVNQWMSLMISGEEIFFFLLKTHIFYFNWALRLLFFK